MIKNPIYGPLEFSPYGKTYSTPCKKLGKSATLLNPLFFSVFYRFFKYFLQGGFPVKLFCFVFFGPPKKSNLSLKERNLVLLKNWCFIDFFKSIPQANSEANVFWKNKLCSFNIAWTRRFVFASFLFCRWRTMFSMWKKQQQKMEFKRKCLREALNFHDKSENIWFYTAQKRSCYLYLYTLYLLN